MDSQQQILHLFHLANKRLSPRWIDESNLSPLALQLLTICWSRATLIALFFLAFLIMMMPEGDGMECCRTVKPDPDTSHIACLLLTARASPRSRADDFISKPFHPEELQLRVRNMLHQRKQLQQFYNRQLTVVEEPLQRAGKTDPFLEQVYVQVECIRT